MVRDFWTIAHGGTVGGRSQEGAGFQEELEERDYLKAQGLSLIFFKNLASVVSAYGVQIII